MEVWKMNSFFFPEEVERFPYPVWGKMIDAITLNQPGRVGFEATEWNAEFDQPGYEASICPGEKVKILARKGNTLLIMPIK
jgi:membrane protein implicated in regulation of membrane protease activity